MFPRGISGGGKELGRFWAHEYMALSRKECFFLRFRRREFLLFRRLQDGAEPGRICKTTISLGLSVGSEPRRSGRDRFVDWLALASGIKTPPIKPVYKAGINRFVHLELVLPPSRDATRNCYCIRSSQATILQVSRARAFCLMH